MRPTLPALASALMLCITASFHAQTKLTVHDPNASFVDVSARRKVLANASGKAISPRRHKPSPHSDPAPRLPHPPHLTIPSRYPLRRARPSLTRRTSVIPAKPITNPPKW